jgi:hypothetical protein
VTDPRIQAAVQLRGVAPCAPPRRPGWTRAFRRCRAGFASGAWMTCATSPPRLASGQRQRVTLSA